MIGYKFLIAIFSAMALLQTLIAMSSQSAHLNSQRGGIGKIYVGQEQQYCNPNVNPDCDTTQA